MNDSSDPSVAAAKTALVTGGGARIGAAIARDLAARGFAVAIHCDSSRDAAEDLAGTIEAQGGRAAVLQADLSDMASVDRLIGRARDALGPVGLLVNNASVFRGDAADAIDWEVWDEHFALHLKAPALLAQNFRRDLEPRGTGLIVNIIDQRVWRLRPGFYSYTLSKSALWTATQTMAQAFAPHIRVNAIGPGPTLPSERQNPYDFARQVEGLLLGRGPELDEFGRTIAYLWETPSITGQMIALDGGQHLAWQTPDVKDIRE